MNEKQPLDLAFSLVFRVLLKPILRLGKGGECEYKNLEMPLLRKVLKYFPVFDLIPHS